MTKDQTFATDLAHFCHHQHWDLNRVTTATALVVNLEQNSYTSKTARYWFSHPTSMTGSDASFSGPRSTTYWKKTSPTTFYDH